MFFCYFVIVSHWKKAWPFICTNLNTLYPRMRCAKFGWNKPFCSWEENFSSMYFANFVIIFIWKTVWLFIWKKIKFKIFKFCQWIFAISLLSPLDKKALLFIWKKNPFPPCTKECFVPTIVEIGPVVLEKKIFILSPLGKKLSSSFEKKTTTKKTKTFPPHKECFVPTMVEIGPVVLEKKIFKLRRCIFAIS